MALPTVKSNTKMLIAIGDGESPEAFTDICGLTAKTFTFQKNTNEFFTPDCDDPDAPAWRDVEVSGRQLDVSGEGLLNMDHLTRFRTAWEDENAVTCRMKLANTVADGGGYWQGDFMLTQFVPQANQGEKIRVSLAFQSSGAVTWVAAV